MNLKDEDLKKSTDYSKDMVDAAYCVLGEIANILENYSNDMRIVGGWVPTLLFPECNHIGSIDVDVLFNQNEILENIMKILKKYLLGTDIRNIRKNILLL